MFHNKFSRFLAVFITVVSLCTFGCKTQPEEVSYSDIFGKWTDDSGSIYEITEDSFKNYGEGWSAYEGNSLEIIPNDDGKSGTIFLKYTVSMNSNFSYSETAPDVGKWYALSYKNLTQNSVSLSGAYKADGKTSTETLEKAIEVFTVENGYFASYSECTKSE
ncbi:MAG: hypothetical protein SPE03_01430 [Treponema sp.]|nr:hypothetical protein [Treponema sp.]